MKLICAGFPKTGSKSCSTALRKLGFTVADIIETIGKVFTSLFSISIPYSEKKNLIRVSERNLA